MFETSKIVLIDDSRIGLLCADSDFAEIGESVEVLLPCLDGSGRNYKERGILTAILHDPKKEQAPKPFHCRAMFQDGYTYTYTYKDKELINDTLGIVVQRNCTPKDVLDFFRSSKGTILQRIS